MESSPLKIKTPEEDELEKKPAEPAPLEMQPGQVEIRKQTSADKPTIKVVIVDDLKDTVEHLRRFLQASADIEVIGEAANGRDAIEQFDLLMPDVMTMDINMPVMDGIAATEEICKKHPDARIIMCSIQNDYAYMRRSILAGARDYIVLPPKNGEDLIEAIRRVAGPESPTADPNPSDAQ